MNARIDVSDVISGLNELKRRGSDLRPLWREVKVVLRDDLEEHFQRAEGSDGAWAPKSAATVERLLHGRGMARKRGKRKGQPTKKAQRRIDNLLGGLKSAWITKLTRAAIEIRSRVWWADVHQAGGSVGRSANVPKREFAYISETAIEKVLDLAVGFIAKAW